ncbi:hypothetical protein [Sporomusa termitida]|nr:hypothetical protein [Sporomusa termitida]
MLLCRVLAGIGAGIAKYRGNADKCGGRGLIPGIVKEGGLVVATAGVP